MTLPQAIQIAEMHGKAKFSIDAPEQDSHGWMIIVTEENTAPRFYLNIFGVFDPFEVSEEDAESVIITESL